MADTAAHLVDCVLPIVPIRQWVLTLPYPLRYRCAWNARLTSEVLRCFLRAVFAALPPPSTEDVARVLAGTARRILRLLEGRGVAGEDDPLAVNDPLMAMLGAASIRSRIATGPEAGEPWRRLGDRVEPVDEDEEGVEPRAAIPPRCVRQGGMSLHADVAVPARDRKRLERLCRYVARPPLALGRLEALTDGRLAYRLKTPWRDGTTHVVMERRELLERLAPLIPPPRAHQVRYHGVLAPCASGRDQVVPAGPEEGETAPSASGSDLGPRGAADGGGDGESLIGCASSDLRPERRESLARRIAWADLLKRVFEVDALRCPACGGRMRLLAAITDPSVARRILESLALPPRAPPLAPANEIDREPIVDPIAFERTLVETQPDPGFDFDQSSVEVRTADDES